MYEYFPEWRESIKNNRCVFYANFSKKIENRCNVLQGIRILIMREISKQMEVMRKVVFFTLIATLLFAACTTKSPETGYHIGWGVIESKENPFSINMDNGSHLLVLSNLVPKFELKDSMRVIVDYTIIEPIANTFTPSYNVRVNMLYDILSKPLLKQSYINCEENNLSEDTVGYDPIRVNRANFSGEFLNIGFQIKASNSNIAHWINLVYDDIEGDPAIKGDTAFLTLRHNAFDDPDTRWATEQYVSFPMKSLVEPPKTERLVKLSWKDYNDKINSSTGTFKLNSTATAGSFFPIATLVE